MGGRVSRVWVGGRCTLSSIAVTAPFKFEVEGPGGFRAVLRHTAFRNIWFAQLAAQLADKFLLFSLIILAYQISGGEVDKHLPPLPPTLPPPPPPGGTPAGGPPPRPPAGRRSILAAPPRQG